MIIMDDVNVSIDSCVRIDAKSVVKSEFRANAITSPLVIIGDEAELFIFVIAGP